MASTFSKLKIELITTGEQSGTWGSTTNNNLGSSGGTYRGLEQAIVGMATLVTADFTTNSYTLPYADSNDDQDFRCLVLDITATLTAAGTVTVPAIQKPYIVMNSSVGGFAVTVKVSGQTGISVPNGAKVLLYNNGTDVGTAITYLTSLTLGSALPVASGGTGQNTYTNGQLLIGNSTGNTLTKATLTQGSGITITNGTGAITISATADVVGPASSTDNAFARFDSTTGKLLQNSTGATLDDAGSPSFTGTVTVAGTSSSAADLRLSEDTDNGTNYIALKAPTAVAANLTFVLPALDGATGQALTTDGAGNLAFSPTGTGDVVGPASSTDNAFARFDSTTGKLLQNSTGATLGDTGSPSFTGTVTVAGTSSSAADLRLSEDTDNGTNYIALKAPTAVAANLTFVLPALDGSNGEAIITDGVGNLAFGPAGGASAGGAIYENSLTISANYTFSAAKNGFSVGPITINTGVSVTVGTDQKWLVFN